MNNITQKILVCFLLPNALLQADTLVKKESLKETVEQVAHVTISGPKEVETGEEFEFAVRLQMACDLSGMLHFYYSPPSEFQYLSHISTETSQFATEYSPEYRTLYGVGCNLPAYHEIVVLIRLKALEQYFLRDRTEIIAPTKKGAKSYFSFIVHKDGEEIEWTKRKTVHVVTDPTYY